MLIKKLKSCQNWTQPQKERLFKIAVENKQVFYVLGHPDVKQFYQKLFVNSEHLTENAKAVKAELQKEKSSPQDKKHSG